MKYFFGIGFIFVLLCVNEVTSLLNLSKTTTAPISLLGSATTTTKKPLQKSTNSLTLSLSKLLGLTSTKPKENEDNTNVIKASDQSSSAKIEDDITTIIPDLRAIQEKLNVKLSTESETVKEEVVHQDVQEYKVQNEEDENEQELHETILDTISEASISVPIVSDLDINMLKPSKIDIDHTSSSVSHAESKQPVADSQLPSIQDDTESSNGSMSEELSIVDDSENLSKIASELNTVDQTVLDSLPNVDESHPVVASTTKSVTVAESVDELLEIPSLNQQEIQIDDASPALDGDSIDLTDPTTESSNQSKAEKLSVPDILPAVSCLPEQSVLPLTSLGSEALQSDGPKRSTGETDSDALTNVDPVVNIRPSVPADLTFGIPSGNILTKFPKVIGTFEKILPNLRFEYQPIPVNSFGQVGNFYNYRSRPLIDIHDNEINLVEIVFD